MVSDEKLIDDLQEFAEELGKTPTARKMRQDGPWSAKSYHNHFGSWNEALEKAGLESNLEIETDISKERLISDLQEFAEQLGKTPTQNKINQDGPWSAKLYHNYFGSWNNALKKAGLEPNHKINISEERLISDLQEFSEELGKTPTKRKMKQDGPWNDITYHNHFGSWNNALKKAGFESNLEIDISKERLISDLQEFAEQLGKTPTQNEMNQDGPWSTQSYLNHFDSWNNALKEAGLEPNNEINISEERLISELQEFAEELGRTPTFNEMRQDGPWSNTTYQNRFGSWNNALEKAGLEINCLGPDERAGTGEDYYGENWYVQRRATVERDGGRCRVCGDDEHVHVHHIKPRRKFDDVSNSNTLDNLITLCPSHHAKLEGKWQDATPAEFEEKAKDSAHQ